MLRERTYTVVTPWALEEEIQKLPDGLPLDKHFARLQEQLTRRFGSYGFSTAALDLLEEWTGLILRGEPA